MLTFTPTADTYVANKPPLTANGAATTMVGNNSGSGGIRVMLVRFDLSSISAQINAGQISRYSLGFAGNSGSASRAVKVFGLINGEGWDEGTTIWSNAPGVIQSFVNSPWSGLLDAYLKKSDLYASASTLSPLSTFTPFAGVGAKTAFDVTSGPVFNFLTADTDKIVTFLIAVDDPVNASGIIFSSKEAASGAPVLTVTTTPPPPPPNPTVVTLQPVADSYVSNKNTTTNFGTALTAQVNNSENGRRVMLMKFDLSSITATVNSLRLDLTGKAMTIGKAIHVYGLVSGESWTENGVTWANGPGVNHAYTTQPIGIPGESLADYLYANDLSTGLTPLTSFTPTVNAGAVAAFNVSSGPVLNFINAELNNPNADKVVTFLIVESDPFDSFGNEFATREVPGQSPLLTVSCVPTSTAPAVIRVVLLGGQSNAVGFAPSTTLPAALLAPQSDVLLYSHVDGQAANADGTLGNLKTLHPGTSTILGNFGPEVTLGQQLAGTFGQIPGTRWAIIKYAKGGSSLSFDWKAGGNATTVGDGTVYQTFQEVVTDGLAKLAATYPTSVIRLDGMVWVQGEQDTNTEANAMAYGSRLAALIGDLRATFGANYPATMYGATLPFFFSQLSAQQTLYSDPLSPRYPAYLQLRQGQQTVAATVAGAYLLDIDGPAFTVNNTDFAHFDTAGQQALGTACAARMANALTLRVVSVVPVAPNNSSVTVHWNAIPGRSYSIRTSGDLQTWAPPFSVGVVGQWTDSTTTGVTARYYRVLEN